MQRTTELVRDRALEVAAGTPSKSVSVALSPHERLVSMSTKRSDVCLTESWTSFEAYTFSSRWALLEAALSARERNSERQPDDLAPHHPSATAATIHPAAASQPLGRYHNEFFEHWRCNTEVTGRNVTCRAPASIDTSHARTPKRRVT
jgi:hypothetical protein